MAYEISDNLSSQMQFCPNEAKWPIAGRHFEH